MAIPANYLSVIINDFDRAGEDAFSVGYSYDFGQVGAGTAEPVHQYGLGRYARHRAPSQVLMPASWI
jgi:hypothetical protein